MIPMAELRRMFAGLGYGEAQSLLQSGNVVFESSETEPEVLEAKLEAETKKKFGLTIDYMVRSDKGLARIIAKNPFEDQAADDPGHLLVLFLKSKATPGAQEALSAAIKGREIVSIQNGNAYAFFPDGVGTSKLTTTIIEKKLGCAATGRNWNTVNKLIAMLKEM